MNIPRTTVSVLLLVFAAACASFDTSADFARNQALYVDVPYATKAPGDRDVFVAPIVDAREGTVLPTQERGFPISYGSDEFWERPVPEMLGEVLARQVQDSGLFANVVEKASPQTVVVKPTLVSFTTGATEAISGSRSFAEIALKLQVLGPADGTGARATLMEQTFSNRQVSALEVNPVSPYRLIGRAMQLSMQKLLAGLDGQNVGRNNVPEGTEVAAPAR